MAVEQGPQPKRGILVEIRGLKRIMIHASATKPEAVGAIAVHMETYLRIQRGETVDHNVLEAASATKKVDRMVGVMMEMAKDHKTRQFVRAELDKLNTEMSAIDGMRQGW